MIQDVSHVVSTITNEANGKVVYVENAGRDSQPAPVVNPDGTITTIDTLTGMPVRIYTSHSNTFVQDGFLSFVATFDSQGNFLSEQVIVHGPHPPGDPRSATRSRPRSGSSIRGLADRRFGTRPAAGARTMRVLCVPERHFGGSAHGVVTARSGTPGSHRRVSRAVVPVG